MLRLINTTCTWLHRSHFNMAVATQNDKLLQFTDLHIKATFKDEKTQISKGRSWKIDELKLKSSSDLHKLWYVLLKEKNLLLSDGILKQKQQGSMGRMGKLSQLRITMSRLLTVISQRKQVQENYRKYLEDNYVKEKTQEYLAKLEAEKGNSPIVVPEITPNLLRAKLRDLKKGKDDLSYIEVAAGMEESKLKFKEYLNKKYDYRNKKVVPAEASIGQDNQDQVIQQFKSTVHEQIIQGIKIPQEEVLRSHVRNWNMLSLKQKRIILGFINARRARESKKEFIRELNLLGQKIAYDLKQSKQQQSQ